MATSSAVTAGTNATATQYNNLRTDAITRYVRYMFELKGSVTVGDEQGPKYIVPAAQTVTSIKHKIGSGTSATFRIQKDTDDVDNSIAASTTLQTDSSPVSAALAADQVLSLDVTAVSGSPTDLLVEVLATETV